MLLAPGAREEGVVGQVANQSPSGTMILVVGFQVEVPSFSTSQARSKPVPTGWAPTPSGVSADVPSPRTTWWKVSAGIAAERTSMVLFQSIAKPSSVAKRSLKSPLVALPLPCRVTDQVVVEPVGAKSVSRPPTTVQPDGMPRGYGVIVRSRLPLLRKSMSSTRVESGETSCSVPSLIGVVESWSMVMTSSGIGTDQESLPTRE